MKPQSHQNHWLRFMNNKLNQIDLYQLAQSQANQCKSLESPQRNLINPQTETPRISLKEALPKFIQKLLN